MKTRILALTLCLALLLPAAGCAAMLDRDYLSIAAHSETPQAEGDSSTLRVETYQGLVNAILYLVLQGQETGTIRLYNYTRDVDADLDAACLEVVQEDPLGAYALDFIKYEVTHIVSYFEVSLTLTYRRTQEQIASIVSVTGANAIRQELCEALSQFRPEVTLRISYFDQDVDYLNTLLRQAYYDTPQAAFGLPQAEISTYPDSGYQRVVEFQLTYPQRREQLLAWQTQLLTQVDQTVASLRAPSLTTTLSQLVRSLRMITSYDPQGDGTIQFLLDGGSASSEGLALALTLYCQRLELFCQVVEGTWDGQLHFWTVVETEDGYRHLDPTVEEIAFRSDAELDQLGYVWDTSSVPACGDPIPEEETGNASSPAE